MAGRRKKSEQIAGDRLPAKAPSGMSEDEAGVWEWAVATCEADDRPLLELHRRALVGLCQSAGDAEEAGRVIRREGMMVDGGREGMKKHPATTVRSSALNTMRAYLSELGLTPTSSSRLPPKEAEKPENPFAHIGRK